MVTVHPLGIVQYCCILDEVVTFTKYKSMQNLVDISSCVRSQSCKQKTLVQLGSQKLVAIT